MIFRTIVFLVLVIPVFFGLAFYETNVQPNIGVDNAIRSVNGNNADADSNRTFQRFNNYIPEIVATWGTLAFLICYASPIKNAVLKVAK